MSGGASEGTLGDVRILGGNWMLLRRGIRGELSSLVTTHAD